MEKKKSFEDVLEENGSPGIKAQNQIPQLWNCDIVVEAAHNAPIFCIGNTGSMLYTSSNKSLKIWDSEKMECISDIQWHTSIKSLCALPQMKILATACDKNIVLWDLVSMTNIGTLKGHKDEI